MMDIVKPKGNEKELILTARKLGYKNLCFACSSPAGSASGFTAALNPSNFDSARKNFDLVISDADARNSLERLKIDIFDCNEPINHIIAKIASDKDKIIGFNFSSVLNAKKRNLVMSRMAKAISLCEKYKVRMAVYSFASSPYEMRNPRDLMSFFSLLGMRNPRNAIDAISERISFNSKLKSGRILAKGIEKAD